MFHRLFTKNKNLMINNKSRVKRKMSRKGKKGSKKASNKGTKRVKIGK